MKCLPTSLHMHELFVCLFWTHIQPQPHGMFSADECFGGRNLNRGIELCAVVRIEQHDVHIFHALAHDSTSVTHEHVCPVLYG